ncbi:MAG TPA: HTTM domain-containing protein [Gemmataceae bacterium]|nr:HTTM domain-containing protein [Gemmataceae bacterium]
MKTFTLNLLNSLGRKAVEFVSKPASPRPLAALRIGLAAALLYQAFAYAGNLLELYGDRGIVQWNAMPFAPPPVMPNLATIRDLLLPLGLNAESCVRLVFYTYVASLVCLMLGWRTKAAAIVAWLTQMAIKTTGITAIYGVDEFAHFALFYCVWMPIANAWSLDLQAGRVSGEPTALARLALRVLQFHMCIVYFSSGIEKATGEQWRNGEAIWRSVMRPDLAMFDLSWLPNFQVLAIILCWGTLVVEIGYPFMIWHRWTKPVWAIQTIGLHVGIAIFLGLWSFAAVMIVLNVAALVISAEPQAEPVALAEPKRRGKLALAAA